MKTVNTLIRLRKERLNDAHQLRNKLETDRDALFARMKNLEAELENEARLAAQSEFPGDMYASFVASVNGQRQMLVREIEALDVAMAQADDIVSEAYQALKSLEISAESELARRREKTEKTEQAGLDEVAMATHLRTQARTD